MLILLTYTFLHILNRSKKKKTFIYFFVAILLVSQTFPSYAISLSSTTDKSAMVDESATPAITSVKDAMKQFKSLSRKEKRDRIKDVKKEIKQYKADKKSGAEPSTNTLLLVILALLLPPLAVYLHEGQANNRFWLSLILTLLFFIPGVIYALIVVLGD